MINFINKERVDKFIEDKELQESFNWLKDPIEVIFLNCECDFEIYKDDFEVDETEEELVLFIHNNQNANDFKYNVDDLHNLIKQNGYYKLNVLLTISQVKENI